MPVVLVGAGVLWGGGNPNKPVTRLNAFVRLVGTWLRWLTMFPGMPATFAATELGALC